MKIIVRHLLHQPTPSLTAMLEREIEALKPSLEIEEARVFIERRPAASPAFHVAVHLVTPGPDLLAESVEHTLRAAVRKAFDSIESKVGHRIHRRLRRTGPAVGRRTVFRN